MTLDEKLAIGCKAVELKNIGDREGYERLMRTIPVPPYHVKVLKETFGLNYLIDSGWNLSEAEAEFGSDWLYSK
jgi:hypothetical protein